MGDFLNGQGFFNDLVMKTIQDMFAWLKSVEASHQGMTNSDETLASRMGDNNVEPPKPRAERDVQMLTNVATLLEQWEDHTIESKQHAGVLEAYVGDWIPLIGESDMLLITEKEERPQFDVKKGAKN